MADYHLVAIGDSLTKGNHSNDVSWAYLLESNSGVYVARRGVSGSTLADMNARYAAQVSAAAAGVNIISHESSEFDAGFGDWVAGDAQSVLSTVTSSFSNAIKVENGDTTGAYIKQTISTLDATDYKISFILSQAPTVGIIYIGTTGTGGGIADILNSGSNFTGFSQHSFTSVGNTAVVIAQNGTSGVSDAAIYDAIEIREDISAEYVAIQGGINDIIGGATAAQMIANVEAITTKAEADTPPKKPIYLAVAPWSGYAGWTQQKQDIADEFNALLATHCVANGCAFIDVYSLLGDSVTSTLLAAEYDSGDGIHFNSAGQQEIASEIYKALIPATGSNVVYASWSVGSQPAAPVWDSQIPDVEVVEGNSLSVHVHVASDTTGNITYTITGIAPGFTLGVDGNLVGQDTLAVATYPITVRATNIGGFIEQTFNFTVVADSIITISDSLESKDEINITLTSQSTSGVGTMSLSLKESGPWTSIVDAANGVGADWHIKQVAAPSPYLNTVVIPLAELTPGATYHIAWVQDSIGDIGPI